MHTGNLKSTRLKIAAVSLVSLKTCKSPSCQALMAVECLPKGQPACTPDWMGNTGDGNIGWHNFGTANQGDRNLGQ